MYIFVCKIYTNTHKTVYFDVSLNWNLVNRTLIPYFGGPEWLALKKAVKYATCPPGPHQSLSAHHLVVPSVSSS